MIVGFSLLFTTAINDILNRTVFLFMPSLLPYGVLAFVFLQSILLSRKFSRAFTQVEQLSERLLSLDKLKDEFLAKTSHELRTPLHGIIGLADALIDGSSGKLPPAVTELLRLMKTSGQRLAHLVNDILDFSKLKHQEIALIPVKVNLQLAVELTIQVLKPLAEKKGLGLSHKLSHDVYVMADENRLQQILHNLIGNAIAYTEAGTITITAQVEDGQVLIQVTDTGIGISAADQERIFESFEQVNPMERPQQEGTGLGLSITKQLVELHKGTLTVKSELGKGSTFTLTLPVSGESDLHILGTSAQQKSPIEAMKQREVAVTIAPAPSEQMNEYEDDRASVLIVDDDPINVQVLVQFLRGQYSLRSTCSGQEAMDWIQSGYRPDIALVDVMMPYVSGFQVGEEIRRHYNPGELPIIFLSAKSQMSDIVVGFEQGGNDYLVKPVEKQELLARLALHLQLAHWNASLELEVDARTTELEESMEERARAMSEVSVLAERNRIAREIHDQVGHILTASVIQLEVGMKLFHDEAPQSVEKMQVVSDLVRKGLHEMRKSVHMLAEEPANLSTFRDVLLQIIDDSKRYADVTIEHTIDIMDDRFEPDTEKTIRHALQEGITNGVRHGLCTHFEFELIEVEGMLQFTLDNNGLPYNAVELGFGLAMMKRTIERQGGMFHISTNAGIGCRLQFTLPL
ncbi:hypothetical protein JCM10914A_43800 [Paenibacillus sp. JCM 10914]